MNTAGRRGFRASISAAVAVALTHTVAVHADAAEDTSGQLQVVTVTAEKVGNNLQKTALSITAITAATLDERNIQSVKDLDSVVPGVLVSVTPSNPLVVTIRGAGNQGVQTETGQPSVSFNENGVYITNPLGMNANFLDVEQVEVLRGPQGSVLGQNTDGGALNITTTRPVLGVFSGNADVGYGSYNLDTVRGAINIPLGDTVAVRAAVQQEHHDGWSAATMVPGTHGDYPLSNENSLNGRVDLMWKPGEIWTFDFWGEHYQNNSHGDALKNVFDTNPDPRQTSADYPSFDEAQNDLAAFNAKGDLSWATIKIVASYQYGALNNPQDVDKLDFAQAVALYGVHDIYPINTQAGHSYTQEFNIASKPGGNLDWIGGLFAEQQTYKDAFLEYQYSRQGVTLPTDMSDPGAIFATGFLGFEAVDKEVLETEAAYAQATYHFTDALRFTGGVRDNLGRQKGYVSAFFATPVTPQKSFSGLTGRASLEYDVTPDNLAYLTWASGLKPGGTNLNPLAEDVAQVYQPETNKTLELGSKNEFLGKTLRVNADVFYSIFGNYQIDSEDPLPYENGLTNIGSIHTYGFEGDFNALLPQGFQVDATLASMGGRVESHNRVLDPLVAQNINRTDGGPYVGNDVADRTAAYFSPDSDVYGKTPPGLSPFTGGLTVRNVTDVYGGRLTSQVNWTYRLGYWARIFNDAATDKVPTLSQWGLSLSYDPNGSRWSVDFLVTNLLNVASVSTRFADIYGVGEVANYYVPPRQFIGRVGYRF